jgi:hypothetical protein
MEQVIETKSLLNEWRKEFMNKYLGQLHVVSDKLGYEVIWQDIDFNYENLILEEMLVNFFKNKEPTLKDIFEIRFIYNNSISISDEGRKLYRKFRKISRKFSV